ncbi:MAG: peptidylprolyl isomerase [Rhodanobacter sp.]|jgi:peptidyl-prolyl cis-trans isomerase SurA|nr:peptidylprolyl isomerase [Rhodanobacter sp.]
MKASLLALALAALIPFAHEACAQTQTAAPTTAPAETPVTAPAASAGVQPINRIVAIVDEDVVLQSELDRQIAALTKQYANAPQQLPPREALERQLLDRLILEKLQIARAESTGVKASDTEIDQAMVQIAKQNNLDVSQLRNAIEHQGLDYNQFRKNVHDQLIVQHLRQRVAQSRVHISDAEIDSLLKNGNINKAQMHLGYIVITVPDGATPEQVDVARAKADEVKKQIDDGMDFAAAAIRYSSAQNALQGGDLGWHNANELPQALVGIADKLSEGQVSAPIRGPNGFHIIKLLGKRDIGSQIVTDYHARHILIKITELTPSDQAEKKITAIRARILAGEDFDKAAKDASEDTQTARLGGDMGWFTGDAFGTRVREQVQKLSKGEISQPFQTDAGWHVLQLMDTRNTDKAGEMQRDQAKTMLFQRKAEDEYESFLRQIRSEAYVEIRLSGASGDTGTASKPGAP